MPANDSPSTTTISAQIDRVAITDLIGRERWARDSGDWETLARCYSTDSLVDISWFRGTGAEFAEAGARMASRMFSFHEIGATIVDIRGDRALGDTACSIHLIGELGGVGVDVMGYVRNRTRARREGGRWLLAGLGTIYIHDVIVPLNPSQVPSIAPETLASFRRSYRSLSHMLVSHGLPARDDLAGVDRPETVASLLARENAWLNE